MPAMRITATGTPRAAPSACQARSASMRSSARVSAGRERRVLVDPAAVMVAIDRDGREIDDCRERRRRGDGVAEQARASDRRRRRARSRRAARSPARPRSTSVGAAVSPSNTMISTRRPPKVRPREFGGILLAAGGADDACEPRRNDGRHSAGRNSRSRGRAAWSCASFERRRPFVGDIGVGLRRTVARRKRREIVRREEPGQRPHRGAAHQRGGIVEQPLGVRPRGRRRRCCRSRSARCARSGRGRCA